MCLLYGRRVRRPYNPATKHQPSHANHITNPTKNQNLNIQSHIFICIFKNILLLSIETKTTVKEHVKIQIVLHENNVVELV